MRLNSDLPLPCCRSIATINGENVLVVHWSLCACWYEARLDRRACADCRRQCWCQLSSSRNYEGGIRGNPQARCYPVCLRLSSDTLHSVAVTHSCSDGSTSATWRALFMLTWWEYSSWEYIILLFFLQCYLWRCKLKISYLYAFVEAEQVLWWPVCVCVCVCVHKINWCWSTKRGQGLTLWKWLNLV